MKENKKENGKNNEQIDTNEFMKYCLDKNIHLIEHVDGSADIIRI